MGLVWTVGVISSRRSLQLPSRSEKPSRRSFLSTKAKLKKMGFIYFNHIFSKKKTERSGKEPVAPRVHQLGPLIGPCSISFGDFRRKTRKNLINVAGEVAERKQQARRAIGCLGRRGDRRVARIRAGQPIIGTAESSKKKRGQIGESCEKNTQ